MPARRSSALARILCFALLAAGAAVLLFQLRPNPRRIGVARADVTPEAPVRLGGYGGRTGPHTGVTQRLWAKALAIDGAGSAPALWLTLDSGGIERGVWLQASERLHRRTGVARDRIVLTLSHTHSAPATTGWAPLIQPEDLGEEESMAMHRYTARLIGQLESVGAEAMAMLRPGSLSWTEGAAGFAKNRRPGGGPTDPALPVLVAEDREGRVRAVLTSYACHCTTCGGGLMQVGGDWAGYAQEAIERNVPGALAMVAIGCAGDADPEPRLGDDHGVALARQHGETVAAEVRRLLDQPRRPLHGKLGIHTVATSLPFDAPFSREEWNQRAKDDGVVGRHARHWLAQLDAARPLPASLPYEISAWHFGDTLALVFLPGEVVVDFSLRLKREFDPARLWVNAYSNWVPGYIPSRRILGEGGYEAESSQWYYNNPARFAPETEDIVIRAVHEGVPAAFRAAPQSSGGAGEAPAAETGSAP
jgi:hypothetical protein